MRGNPHVRHSSIDKFAALTTSHVPSQPNPNKQAAMPGPAASASSAAAAEPDDAALNRELAGAVDRVVSAEALLALSAQIRASGNDEEEEMDDGEEEEPPPQQQQEGQEQGQQEQGQGEAPEQEGGGAAAQEGSSSTWRKKRSKVAAKKARARKGGQQPAKKAKRRHMSLSEKVYLVAQMEKLHVGVGRGSKKAGISFERFAEMMVQPPRGELGWRKTLSHRTCREILGNRAAIVKAALEHGACLWSVG
jgi:hypothetical protein